MITERLRPVGFDTGAAGLSVLVVALLTHYEVLGYWFVGPDTLTLIETSRIVTPADALVVLTKPLMYGSDFVRLRGLFYRPVSSLSYAVDYWVWGLDPFGYHLTDLALHALASVLVFALVRVLLGGNDGSDTTALVSGCLFALHPITAEVVPVPSRRHDVIATIFLLVSILLFVRAFDERRARHGQRGEHRTGFGTLFVGSVLAYVLALGSKETAVVVVPLVATWSFLRSYAVSDRALSGLRSAITATAPYLGATIGYVGWRYVVLGGLGGYVGSFERLLSEPPTTAGAEYVLSLFYPVDFVGGVLGRSFQFVPNALYAFVAAAVTLLALVFVRAESVRSLFEPRRNRVVALMGVWLAAPLVLAVWAGGYSIRSGYVSLAPAVVSITLPVTAATREVVHSRGSDGDGSHAFLAVAALALVLLVFLVVGSPLAYPYDEWEHAGNVSEEVLPAVSEAARGLPPDATIALIGLPARSEPPPAITSRPQVKTMLYPAPHSIAAWVRLRHPNSSVRAIAKPGTRIVLEDRPVDVRATLSKQNGRSTLHLRYRSRSVESSRLNRT